MNGSPHREGQAHEWDLNERRAYGFSFVTKARAKFNLTLLGVCLGMAQTRQADHLPGSESRQGPQAPMPSGRWSLEQDKAGPGLRTSP